MTPSGSHPKHPERVCWGCSKLCRADDLACGNGTVRTPHPIELFGDDYDAPLGENNDAPLGENNDAPLGENNDAPPGEDESRSAAVKGGGEEKFSSFWP